jgi:hypothetical protein
MDDTNNASVDSAERLHDAFVTELKSLNSSINEIPLNPKWKTLGIIVGIIVFLLILLIAMYIGSTNGFFAGLPIAILLGVAAGFLTYSISFSNGQPELAKLYARRNYLRQQMNPRYPTDQFGRWTSNVQLQPASGLTLRF